MKTSTFILSIVKPHRRYLLFYVLCTAIQVLFSLFTLATLIPLLEIIFGSQSQSLSGDNPSVGFGQLKAWLTQELSALVETSGQPIYAIYGIAVLLITASCIQNASRYLASRAMTKLRAKVYANLRETLYKGLNSASLHYIKSNRRGQILSKASNDLTEIEHGILNVAEALFRDSLTILALLYVLFSIQTMLTLFILALIAVVAVLIGSIGRRLKQDSKAVQHDQGRLMDFFSEAISGFRLFKAYGVEDNEKQRFDNLNDSWKKGYQSMLFRKYLASPLTEFLAIIVVASILIVGSLFVFNGKLLASEFIFFIAAFGYIVGPAKSLSSAFFSYQRGSAAAERIQHFLSEVTALSTGSMRKTSNVESLTMAQNLHIENLSFTYEDQAERLVLNKLSIHIEKGKHIALVGPSGSGKSTLFDLILGFYKPTEGSIYLDMIPIQDLNIELYRKCFGLVTQDPILL
ncbi:MAG: ABC transporter ATP-binding protein, partial [Bacteroidota bacterium]|nr:ABC transporter ATP-binding protein [Bacteroidota bacterium]